MNSSLAIEELKEEELITPLFLVQSRHHSISNSYEQPQPNVVVVSGKLTVSF